MRLTRRGQAVAALALLAAVAVTWVWVFPLYCQLVISLSH